MEREEFKKIFKHDYDCVYFAPGRINLIGEHLDYNLGYVLPMPIDLGISLYLRKRDDNIISLASLNFKGDTYQTKIDNIMIKDGHWTTYLLGPIKVLEDNNIRFKKGYDILISSNLPMASGLSSSACLEVLSIYALCNINHIQIDSLTQANYAREAEIKYCHVNCGIMDQACIALGMKDSALYLNACNLEYEYVRIDFKNYDILILSTNKKRALNESKFNERVEECSKALKLLNDKCHHNNKSLCEYDLNDLEKIKDEEILYKRAKHVISENERVKNAKTAIENGDVTLFASLLNESHKSLKEDYEVSGYHLDLIVELALKYGALGARMTGAGFGGCAICIVERNKIASLIKHVKEEYKKATNIDADIYECIPIGGPRKKMIDFETIENAIASLIEYAYKNELIEDIDKDYIRNQYYDLFSIDNPSEYHIMQAELDDILEYMLNYAYKYNLIESSSIVEKDLFDTKIMGIITPLPREVVKKFNLEYDNSPQAATNYLYNLSKITNYIRTTRIEKDLRWKIHSAYGNIDITINMSKPEKDPRDIERARNMKISSYPKCLLCKEYMGFAGNLNQPARQNIRLIPMSLNNEKWYLQYSPYSYYNEHCIVLKEEHNQMYINKETFTCLSEFVEKFPHYFMGSNAELPIVGGSILSHEHFQGGKYHFAMFDAKSFYDFKIKGFEDIDASLLTWPLSVIRLESKNRESLVELSNIILDKWRKYSNEDLDIISETKNVLHNTITPIVHKDNDKYVFDLVLRNNRSNEEYPLGLFHPHDEYHHIKKENIGLIEVLGLAVLPRRLESELNILKNAIINHIDYTSYKELDKHNKWIKDLLKTYKFNSSNIDEILRNEVGSIFVKILENAGVFKQDEKGKTAFIEFARTI